MLISDDDDPDQILYDDKLDHLAANENLNQFFNKVDQHLSYEVALIQDW